MKASDILTTMASDYKFQAYNEIEFDYMGLSSSKVDGILCTFLDDEKYYYDIDEQRTIAFTTAEIYNQHLTLSAIVTNKPRIAFFEMHNFLVNNCERNYIRKRFKTTIGENCVISKMAFIEGSNVQIGNNVIIEEFVSIKANTTIKDNTIIRAGSVIGGEGFEQKRNNKELIAVKHVGGVIVGNSVEIQQNVCIDKAIYPWDNTIIGDACKLDNLIHIAHAVKVGKGTLIAASSLIGGRTNIGEDAWIGPGVTISNNIRVADRAKISIGAVVTKNVNEGERVSGNFAIEHQKFLEFIKSIR